MNREALTPIAYLKEVDAGTDNACFVVCAKGDPGSFPVISLTAITEAGMVVAPREPTEAMLIDIAAAIRDFLSEDGPYPRSKAVYKAILRTVEGE